MLKRRIHALGAVVLALTVSPLLLGCGGDDEGNGGTGPQAAAFVGTWNATSFTVDGTDLIAAGTTISFTFTGNTYSFTVTGDTNDILCDPGPTCADGGDLGSTSGTIIFDPGTVDEVTFSFNVTGDILTVSGTIEGSAVTATFQRV